jgi:transcriptional regulator with XRE-family HTH domain
MASAERRTKQLQVPRVESNRPFPETLKTLLKMQRISQRELMRRTRAKDGWGSPGTISELWRGNLRPSMKAMESIAGALDESPRTFAEYRLAEAREKLDPDVTGLQRALDNLEKPPWL